MLLLLIEFNNSVAHTLEFAQLRVGGGIVIVSHRHKFIFFKTKKTAGTSIELALRPICGPDDMISPVVEDRKILNLVGGPRNWQSAPSTLWARMNLRRRWRGKQPRADGLTPHITAEKARPFIPEQAWKTYFKFTIERNPWDRQVSHYYYHIRPGTKRNMTFEEFMRTKRAILNNYDIYSLDGEIIADFVIRYENIEEDFRQLQKLVGIDEPVELPRAKTGIRKSGRDYHSYYSDETKAMVSDWYRREIQAFDYSF